MTAKQRVSKGVPAGGQFAAGSKQESPVALAGPVADHADHPLRQTPPYTVTNTPRGRVAARRQIAILRERGDDDGADRIELSLLATEIEREYPEATHVTAAVSPDSVAVSAVNFQRDTSLGGGWHCVSQPGLTDDKQDPLTRLARIAGRPGGVFARMERMERPSGWRVVSLSEMSLLAADLPADEEATSAELDWLRTDLGLVTDKRLRQPLEARHRELQRWAQFNQRSPRMGST